MGYIGRTMQYSGPVKSKMFAKKSASKRAPSSEWREAGTVYCACGRCKLFLCVRNCLLHTSIHAFASD